MARGKQPPVSHALQKQQSLLDCFLEAQAKRLGRRPSGAKAASQQAPSQTTRLNVADDDSVE